MSLFKILVCINGGELYEDDTKAVSKRANGLH